jgi:SAM-dependent methyltransferase
MSTYRNKHLKYINSGYYRSAAAEGFTQKAEFVLKQDAAIYDDFYADVYDIIHKTHSRSQWELKQLLKLTDADTNNSVILDVGSATGYVVNELQQAGYKAYGIDISEEMVKVSSEKYPSITVKNADVLDPMNYERHTFTHILCMNFTVYEFQNKAAFFRNSYLWLKSNAYLLIHLVDPQKFNAVMPASEETKKSPDGRVTNSLVKFYDFDYRAQYEFPKNNTTTQVSLKETFKDRETKHIRQNERVLYMEGINDILKIANREGFVFHGKISMKKYNGDDNQYLYVLEKTM